jgi:hypothetical protein
MLKRYKNVFFGMIEAAGLSLGDFTAKGGIEKHTKDPAFIIRYHPANLTFTAINPSDNPHLFYGSYTIYAPTVLKRRGKEVEIVEGPPSDFSETREAFAKWLSEHVRTSIDEELLPDLWATVSAKLLPTNSSPRSRTAHFTDEERRQLKLALATFRVRLIQTFRPNKEQLHVVSQQLDYLVAAVDRLNKFDWKGVALSTLIGISTALTLDTERGRQLYGLFQQALSTLLYLIR